MMTNSPSDVTVGPVTVSTKLYDADWAKHEARRFDAVLLRELRLAFRVVQVGMIPVSISSMAMAASLRRHWIEKAEREAKREREEK